MKELVKGYFPHFWNTAVNANYVGPLPSPEMYGADSMKNEARDAFLDWHKKETEAGTVFDMKRDLVKYCQSDVDILARCCMKFRDIFKKVSLFIIIIFFKANFTNSFLFSGNLSRPVLAHLDSGVSMQLCVPPQFHHV